MKRVLQMWLLALAVLVGVSVVARPSAQEGTPRSHGEMSSRLSRRGSFGRINIQGGKKHFPDGAEVSIERKRPDDVKRKIHQGWSKRKRSGKSAASPNILASYDISIRHGGRKWQPDAGDPVRVTVDLDEPVAVTAASTLGVVHLSDDGTVEELPASRYGFTYNADKTAVTAFWFSATGFSIYTIVDTSGDRVTPRRFYHFLSHPSDIDGTNAVQALPYKFQDHSGDVVNVEIVKDGETLMEPPIPEDIVEDGQLKSSFEGWYVVHKERRAADASEAKLDSETEPFQFVWPVGVSGNHVNFHDPIEIEAAEQDGDWDYWLAPLYEHSRFLRFYEAAEDDPAHGEHIVTRKIIALNDETGEAHIRVSDVSAPLRNSNDEYFSGWSYKNAQGETENLLLYSETTGEAVSNVFLTVNQAVLDANGVDGVEHNYIPLRPIYVTAHFLHFDHVIVGKGAKYVPSIFVRRTAGINKTQVSELNGYTFEGWYVKTSGDAEDITYGQKVVDANGNVVPNLHLTGADIGLTGEDATKPLLDTDADGKLIVWQDMTVYAKWTPNTMTTYRVVVWRQKVTDAKNALTNDYDYVMHYTSDEKSSSTPTNATLATSFSGSYTEDGTTTHVSNVDLTRLATNADKDWIPFQNPARIEIEGDYHGTLAPEGTTVVHVYYDRKLITLTFRAWRNNAWNDTVMTGLYGQSLAQNGYTWNTSYDWYDDHTGSGRNMRGSGTRTTFLAAFITTQGGDETFFGFNAGSTSATVNFFLEDSNGTYVLTNSVGTSGGTFNISDKFEGYSAYEYQKDSGGWTSVGERRQDGDSYYYGNGVSSFNTLDIRFRRNRNSIIFCDVVYGVENEILSVDDIPFESSLAAYNLPENDTRFGNWNGRDRENYIFDGWYEDASLSKKFNFSTGIMPNAPLRLFAKWTAVEYLVKIDPNGGSFTSSAQSTWFRVAYNELIGEYRLARDYVPDQHNGGYYYLYEPYEPSKDHKSDQWDYERYGDPSIAANRPPRRAQYTTDPTDVIDTTRKYRYSPGAYAFMGWYKVLEDGTVSRDPFNFGEYVTGPTTLRAIWRRSGLYKLRYQSVDPDGQNATEITMDPADSEGQGYIDDGETTIARPPSNYDHDRWVWEGWQVVDSLNNNVPLTNIRSPGDLYIVHDAHADLEGVIHFQAVFSSRASGQSLHIPPTVDLVLDSNENAGLSTNVAIATVADRVGTYTNSVGSLSGLDEGVWFAGQMDNFSVNLADYIPAFVHRDGYFLLGWDTNRNVEAHIPAFYANETIGIDKTNPNGNVLYAVWEPQVYLEFENQTDGDVPDIKLNIPGWSSGEVFCVNSMEENSYRRAAFTNFVNGSATFTLRAHEKLYLVLPQGADMDFNVLGKCPYPPGTKLITTLTGVDGNVEMTDTAYPIDEYGILVAGVMRVSETPAKVTFTNAAFTPYTTVPVRYFLHEPDGTVREITDDASAWNDPQGRLKRQLQISYNETDLAATLAYDVEADIGVRGFLNTATLGEWGQTTFGVGSASATSADVAANFRACEYRTLTKVHASGGSYIRYVREHVEWSRYGYVHGVYEDVAVYVCFYKRTPVQVTVAKNVIGTEADKERKFNFTASFAAHSASYDQVVRETRTYTRRVYRTRTYTSSWFGGGSYSEWSGWQLVDGISWQEDPNHEEDLISSTRQQGQDDQVLFPEPQHTRSFQLDAATREPLIIYYNKNMGGTNNTQNVSDTTTTDTAGSTYYEVVSSWERINGSWTQVYKTNSVSASSATLQYATQTRTLVTDVTRDVTYQWEDVTVTEDADALFDLVGVADNPELDTDSCSGVANLAARTYTVSSKRYQEGKEGQDGFFEAQLTDTAIFTNERKMGTLAVSKRVVGGDAVDEAEDFRFTLTLDEPMTEAFTNKLPSGVTSGPFRKVYSFTLKHGDRQEIAIPQGVGYSLREDEVARFSTALPAAAEGSVGAGTAELEVVNTRKVDLTLAVNDRTVKYDGSEQTGWTVEEAAANGASADGAYTLAGLKTGDTLAVANYQPARGTEAGTYDNGSFANARIRILRTVDGEDQDVTGEYLVTATAGALTINSRRISVAIQVESFTHPYTGAEQSFAAPYARTVTDADTGETVTDENIYVLVPAEFLLIKGTDIGRYPSVVESSGVTVQHSDSYELAGVTVVNGELIITSAPYLIQRATGERINLLESVPFAVLAEAGLDDTATGEQISDALNAFGPNGLRRWESLRMGLTPTSPSLSTRADGVAGTLRLVPATAEPVGLGYTMLRDLRRYVDGAWVRVDGPYAGANPNFTLDLTDANGGSRSASGYYRVATLLIPESKTSVTNVILSTNIVGVLEVSTSNENVIVGVPWRQLASDPSTPVDITVSNHVSAVNLTAGDSVYALKNNATYEMWKLQDGGAWDSVTTISTAPAEANYQLVTTAADADKQTFARGKCVWLSRKNPVDAAGNPKPFFLIGQYDPGAVDIAIAGGERTSPAYTLIAAPGCEAVRINDFNWGNNPTSTDMITIPNGSTTIVLRWVNGAWGRYEPVWNEALQRNRNTFVPYTDPIPAGTGFWYARRAGAFSITWQPSEIIK